MDTLAIATDRNIVREITNRFIARPELGQTTTADRSRADPSMVDLSRADLSRVEARASWSPRACVAFSTLSLLVRLKEMLSRIFLWPKDDAATQNRDLYRSRRHGP